MTVSTRSIVRRYLLSSLAPWIPLCFVTYLITLFSLVHFAAYRLGHLDISNEKGERVTFLLPPISLTGNHPPEYMLYAFGCLGAAVFMIRYITRLELALKRSLNVLHSVASHQHQPQPQPRPHSSQRRTMSHIPTPYPAQLQEAPPVDDKLDDRRRLAFWRDHFHTATHEIPSYSGSSPSQSPPKPLSHGSATKAFYSHPRNHSVIRAVSARSPRPIAPLFSPSISPRRISSRSISPHHANYQQATYPVEAAHHVIVRRNPPPQSSEGSGSLTSSASISEASSSNMSLQHTRPRKGGLSRRPLLLFIVSLLYTAILGFTTQAIFPVQLTALEEIGSSCYETTLVPAKPLREGTAVNSSRGHSSQSLSERKLSLSFNASHLIHVLRGLDPSRPRLGGAEVSGSSANGWDENRNDFAISRVFCPELKSMDAQLITVIHALGALFFFILAFTVMGLFTVWLATRRLGKICCQQSTHPLESSWSSILIKAALTISPWCRPLEHYKAFLLGYMSLVEWAGLTQRLAVACILVYICTLGIELHQLREGLIRLGIRSVLNRLDR